LSGRTYDPGVAAAPEIHRWSPEEYHRLIASGALDDLDVDSLGDSEPQPDIAVIPVDVERPFHPSTAALAIEVAHSSLRRDLEVR
jgi:hypothetical protein